MAHVLRACLPSITSGTRNEDKNKVIESTPPQLRDHLDSFVRAANITYVVNWDDEGLGEPNSFGEYNGCIGQLQRNASDMMMREMPYPSSAEDVGQGLIGWDTKIAFISAYNLLKEDKSHYAQMASCVYSFDGFVWFLCLISLICFFLAALVSRSAVRASKAAKSFFVLPDHKYILYQVLTHMTAYGSLFSSNRVSKKILYLSISLFALLVLFFFMSMMSTELVVAEQPDTFKSFQDLLDKDISINFLKLTNIHLKFKSAPPGDVHRKLWDASVAKLTESKVLLDTDGEIPLRTMYKTVKRQVVMVGESIWTPMNLECLCIAAFNQIAAEALFNFPDLPRLQAGKFVPYYSIDKDSPVVQQQFLYNPRPNEATSRLKKVMRYIFESGLNGHVRKITDMLIDLVLGLYDIRSRGAMTDHMSKCIDNIIITPPAEVNSVSLDNFVSLYVMMIAFFLLLGVILIIEIRVHARAKRTRLLRVLKPQITITLADDE